MMTVEGPRTMLGFPAWPSVDPDPRRLSTGNDALDRMLIRWLDAHEGERDLRREGDVCVLVDRGEIIRATTGAANGEVSAYEDSARKALNIALQADYFEALMGRRPGPGE